MKKLIYISFFALASVLAFTACDREQIDGIDSKGNEIDNRPEVSVSLAALKLSVDVEVSVKTRSTGVKTDDFIIRIYDMDKGGKMVQEWKYSDMPEIVALKVGDYSIVAMSHEIKPAAFDEPYYFAKENFVVAENEITDLDALVCSLQNIKVTIEYDDELKKMLGEDVKVNVVVGEGKLDFVKGETRAGYFQSVEETNFLTANLEGTIDGEKQVISEVFSDVKAGQHRIVRYKLRPVIPGEGFAGLKLKLDVTCSIIDKGMVVNPGDEEVIDPDKPEGDAPTIVGNGFDIASSIVIPEGTDLDNPYPVLVKITAENGVKKLVVEIQSSNSEFQGVIEEMLAPMFDLANPGELEEKLSNLGLPVSDAVLNAKEIDFDITNFTPMLGIYGAGTHRFTITVTDNGGLRSTATLTLITN